MIIDINTTFGAGTASTFINTAKDLEQHLIKNGINKSLTLHSSGINFNFSIGNEFTINEIKDSSVLLPIATMDPRGFFGEVEILEDIKSKGFKAIKFFPDIQGWKLNNIVFKDILEINKKTKLPIIVNTKKLGDISLLDSVYNYDYPIILSGVYYKNATECVAFVKKHKNAYLETGFLNSHYVLYKFIDVLGIEKIVFGSNSPKNLAKVSIDFILTAKISDIEKEYIFSKNISRIL